MSERRLSAICAVVKRPDLHCGDYHVTLVYWFWSGCLLKHRSNQRQKLKHVLFPHYDTDIVHTSERDTHKKEDMSACKWHVQWFNMYIWGDARLRLIMAADYNNLQKYLRFLLKSFCHGIKNWCTRKQQDWKWSGFPPYFHVSWITGHLYNVIIQTWQNNPNTVKRFTILRSGLFCTRLTMEF